MSSPPRARAVPVSLVTYSKSMRQALRPSHLAGSLGLYHGVYPKVRRSLKKTTMDHGYLASSAGKFREGEERNSQHVAGAGIAEAVRSTECRCSVGPLPHPDPKMRFHAPHHGLASWRHSFFRVSDRIHPGASGDPPDTERGPRGRPLHDRSAQFRLVDGVVREPLSNLLIHVHLQLSYGWHRYAATL